MSKIFDCVMFFNELDMLETRFHILEDVIDNFVVCEAGETHSGHPKPYYLTENWKRFAPWHKKIIYVRERRLSDHADNSWARERYHRSQINEVYANTSPDDWIIVADCDEIPNPDRVEMLHDLRPEVAAAKFELDFYYYDLMHRVKQGWAIGARRAWMNADPNDIRTCANVDPVTFLQGGWHFSYFGGAQQVVQKVDAFMHHGDPGIAELPRDPAYIADKIRAGVDLFNRDGFEIERVPLSVTLPRYILDNLDKYERMGWIAE